jgi:hypothetical protein
MPEEPLLDDVADTGFSPSESSAAIAQPDSAGTPSGAFMRPASQRNSVGATTPNDNWAVNGCYPSCLAIIVRWWAEEDNPETQDHLRFPFATAQCQIAVLEFWQQQVRARWPAGS